MKKETSANHTKMPHVPDWNAPTTAPIYQSVKFKLRSIDEFLKDPHQVYLYSRELNPTVRLLEESLAKIQGTEDALCVASGMNAIAASLIALTKAGDHIIMFNDSYRPGREFIRQILSKFNITHTLLSLSDIHLLENFIIPGKTAVILFESLTNPMCRIPDIDKIINLAKKHNIKTLMDNTFAGIHQLDKWEVDLYIHSLTKFVAGHGDALGGVICGKQNLIRKIHETSTLIGGTLDPQAAFLIQRGLKTFFLRYRAQSASAIKIAHYLEQHEKIEKVFYPALKTHPEYNLAHKYFIDFGGMLAFNLKNGNAENLITKLKIFQYAVSLGATESLAVGVYELYAGDLAEEVRRKNDLTPRTIRLSIGVEDVDDLISDLEQALKLI